MADKKKKEVTKEAKLLNTIATFISINKKIIVLICCIIAAVSVIAVVISTTATKSNEKELVAVDALETRYTEFKDMASDAPEHYDTYSTLINDLNSHVKGKSYASVKAQYLMGLTYYSQNHWQEAYDAFINASKLNSKIYLYQLSLINAASCKENMASYDEALEIYRTVSEVADSGLADKALFSMGRIYLSQNKTALAKATFQQLVDSASFTEYKALAKNIINTL